MKQDRISGIAIIVGCLMAVLTMALHPVGGSLRTDIDHLTRIASVAVAVHVLAMAAVGVQMFGFLGFHGAISGGARARAGLVAYAIGWSAVFGAALAGGILSSWLIRIYPGLEPTEQAAAQVLWRYNGMVNHALASVYIVATCAGTAFWSLITLREDTWWKATSLLGLLVAAIGLLSLLTGQLRMTVHGFGMFVFGYSAWAVAVGLLLCRPSATR